MYFSAYVFKSERTVAALSITGLGEKSCGVYIPISLTKSAVLSSMYTSPNQLMIGLSEVPSDWSNLSRKGVLDFPLSLVALVDPPTSPHVQVTVSLPSLPLNLRRCWLIGVPGNDIDLSLSPLSCRRLVNYPASLLFLFIFLGIP